MVEGHGGHRRRSRRPRRHLRDAGAEVHPRRSLPPPGQRRERVRSVGLGGPHRSEPESFGRIDLFDDIVGRPRLPVSGEESEFHVCAAPNPRVRHYHPLRTYLHRRTNSRLTRAERV